MSIPNKDFIIYDGDCGFCQRSINILQKIVGDKIDYIHFQSLEPNFLDLTVQDFNQSIKFFVHEDSKLYHAAYAAFKALSYNPSCKIFLWAYEYVPFFSLISEAVYMVIARNRSKEGVCEINEI